jgi:hypothetical protein
MLDMLCHYWGTYKDTTKEWQEIRHLSGSIILFDEYVGAHEEMGVFKGGEKDSCLAL